jgi:hypothetical protein
MEYILNKASSIEKLRNEIDATMALASRGDNPATVSMPESRGFMTRPFVSAFSFSAPGPPSSSMGLRAATPYPANSVDSSQLLMQSIGVLMLAIIMLVLVFMMLVRSYIF